MNVDTIKLVVVLTMLIGSGVATPVCMWMWRSGKFSEKDMVGITLLLSLLALNFSAVTSLFVV